MAESAPPDLRNPSDAAARRRAVATGHSRPWIVLLRSSPTKQGPLAAIRGRDRPPGRRHRTRANARGSRVDDAGWPDGAHRPRYRQPARGPELPSVRGLLEPIRGHCARSLWIGSWFHHRTGANGVGARGARRGARCRIHRGMEQRVRLGITRGRGIPTTDSARGADAAQGPTRAERRGQDGKATEALNRGRVFVGTTGPAFRGMSAAGPRITPLCDGMIRNVMEIRA